MGALSEVEQRGDAGQGKAEQAFERERRKRSLGEVP
jgi:hypothetical protein